MPEGAAMVTPMRVGGCSGARAFLLAMAAGAPMGLGAYFGALMGEISYRLIGICLAFAGGTMLYITLGELIPKGRELDNGNISTLAAILGFVLGVLVSKTF
jgi:ZIP family zinc transporter